MRRRLGDSDVQALREVGLTDLGIVQITHIVSDFASYNRLNLALDTDYDYRSFWRQPGVFHAASESSERCLFRSGAANQTFLGSGRHKSPDRLYISPG